MMQAQVFISGLILLLPGVVDSAVVVKAVVGDPVTLPCNYSTNLGVSNTCWGLGECQSFYCERRLIRTHGYRVTYQRSSRYQLQGPISEGNVSLTIQNADQSDSGHYCCTVEIPGSFSYVNYMLEVKAEIPTSPSTSPTTTGRLTTTGRPATGKPTTRILKTRILTATKRPTITMEPRNVSMKPTDEPASGRVSTLNSTTPVHTQTYTPDWKNTVTFWNDSWNNYTESIPSLNPPEKMTKDFALVIPIAALLLLLFVGALAVMSFVDSAVVVKAVVGDPVTLPCNYSTNLGVSNTCWGLGECQFYYCARTLIWTNGYGVTYQRNRRYQLQGSISEGNVSLTIQNADQSDSGHYCCTVEIPGSFSYVNYLLEVKPDWKNTVTFWNDSWNNYTESIPSLNPPEKMTKDFALVIPIATLLLLLFVGALAVMSK
ncbi:T-cell immunoglobulin and mucin domain-containing protein 2-like [Mesocricetus auratus]|uniref:T-cell immunoglobulin and mucin domain-containing protein 2-like n=1 Tax=Mesocricetus auratus TaxID=10036 RepID=UPI001AEF5934|nr:T-cell immunoglobulin and mucin domain-containing protein 2-like [Mesocricetus auratus]